MSASFFFYDLETSGLSARDNRVMQFAGQRTNLKLEPIGEPVNVLIKLTPDILPDPQAVMVTGITPQKTLAEGITEAEFLKLFHDQIAIADTIFVGYNSVRFDDEFMRYLHYRNFYDPYEWQWQDGRSRWDLLDLVRMTRALRPDGIKWPVDLKGKPTNRLELLTAVNELDHLKAHDALSDVSASIAIAKLIFDRQPKLFKFLLAIRDKKDIIAFVLNGQPFVYTSGKYPAENEKTSVVYAISENASHRGALVYDLRHDPTTFEKMSPQELVDVWRWRPGPKKARLPIKTLQYNHCPAVAPLNVLDEASQSRLHLDMDAVQANLTKLKEMIPYWAPKVLEALEIMDKDRELRFVTDKLDVDSQLYEGFLGDQDRQQLPQVRQAEPANISSFAKILKDQRLKKLLPLYKARNYPDSLSDKEKVAWDKYRLEKLLRGEDKSRLAHFEIRMQDIASDPNLTKHQQAVLTELQSYAENLISDAAATVQG